MKNLILLLYLLIVGVTCGAQAINPPAPVATTIPTFDAPLAVPSSACIPLTLPAPSLQIIEDLACTYYQGHAVVSGALTFPILYSADIDYEVWRAKKFEELHLRGNTFSISAKLYYWADGLIYATFLPVPLSVQCGWDDEEARQIIFGFDSQIQFDPSYSLSARTTVRQPIVPEGYRCLVSHWDRDITDNISNLAYKFMSSNTKNFEDAIKQTTNFRPAVEVAWKELQKPIQISPLMWLVLNPKYLSGGDIIATEDIPQKITTSLGLQFQPQIVYGNMPVVTATALPQLQVRDCAPTFTIRPSVQASFASINTKLNDPASNIVGNKFLFQRKTIEIETLRVYKSNQLLTMMAKVHCRAAKRSSGNRVWNCLRYFFESKFYKRDGTIYFTSTPQYDPNGKVITFPDLDYDVVTKDRLLEVANWVLKTRIKEALKENSRIAIDKNLDDLKASINSSLQQSTTAPFSIHGSVNEMSFRSLLVSNDNITIGLTAKGDLAVSIQ